MSAEDTPYAVRLATTPDDLTAAQALRYQVFVRELGGDGPLVDHTQRLERDAFDPFFDHLILVDRRIDPATRAHVIGAYRVLPSDRRAAAGRFYSETEFDLAPLLASGRKLLELGRSCVRADHRGPIGRSSITATFRIFDRNQTDTLYAEGDSVIVWIDPRTGSPIPLPAHVRSALE